VELAVLARVLVMATTSVERVRIHVLYDSMGGGLAMKTLAVLCLLVSTATAYAECAWVMWTETESMSQQKAGQWKSTSFDRTVYGTRKECEVALVDRIELDGKFAEMSGTKVFRHGEDSIKDRFIRIDSPRRRVIEVWPDKQTIVKQFSCLPDTIDPRGPKGK
jgi:hypothetical protein